ncbi:hypothetical protein ACXO82_02165 [Lactobacillus delbrueckii subsp. bulgaricus]|nr:hypothetical protein [Lactobacillus delbrueckii]MCD5454749.1 hypothetical protein [Lactobacillus delbrueckii subsp. bulgaricus]MCD5475429.1 hypothetical protein [Lactobacillus delbrueckii subsp. bulgaricus]
MASDLQLLGPVHVVSLFGAPLDVHYFPNLQKGVDTSGVLVLAYDDKQASLTAAKDSQAFAHSLRVIAVLEAARDCMP